MGWISSRARMAATGVVDGVVDEAWRLIMFSVLLGLSWGCLWIFGALHLLSYFAAGCFLVAFVRKDMWVVFAVGMVFGWALPR